LVTLGWIHVGLVALFIFAAVFLWRRAHRTGLSRALTWDCGYAAPIARMQYSGGSFAGIAAGWFGWLLLPITRRQRPRGPMPGRAIQQQRIPETVLERVIGPVAETILHISTAVRRLQHGHLQSYILYLVAGITALSGLVL